MEKQTSIKPKDIKIGQSKSFFNTIKSQLTNIRNDVSKLVNNDKMLNQKKIYNHPPNNTSQSNHMNVDQYKKNQSKLVDNNKKCQEIQKQLENKKNIPGEIDKEKSNQIINKQNQFLKNQIKSLYQQIKNTKSQYQYQIGLLTKENQFLKGIIQNMKKKNQNKTTNDNLIKEKDHKIKQLEEKIILSASFQQKIIKQFQNAKQKLIQKQNQIYNKKKQSQSKIIQLKNIIKTYQNNKNKEIQFINAQFQRKNSIQQSINYRQLGESFETKINELVDENYKLKNRISSLQSRMEELSTQNISYQQTITIYQQRDKTIQDNNIHQNQINQLLDKIQKLEDQRDAMTEKYQLEIMKLQNKIDSIKDNTQQNLPQNKLIKDQINQIQELRKKLKQKNQQIVKLNGLNKKNIEEIIHLKKNK